MRKSGAVLLDRDDSHARHFPSGATEQFPRLEFYARPPQDAAVARLLRAVPVELTLQHADRETIEHCQWRTDLLQVFGSVANFLGQSVGSVLLDRDQILSEAHAFFWGEGEVEIGTITHEAYRGLGYAALTCAHLIHACEARGFQTYWGCDIDNPASAAVARKLGYTIENNYELVYYPAIQQVAPLDCV